MRAKPKPPILPRSVKDPTGVDRLERGAMREIRKRLRKALRSVIALLELVPVEPAINRRYTYRLDESVLSMLLSEVGRLIEGSLLGGDGRDLWFYETYVAVVYRRGTAQEFANLAQQSPVYKAARSDVASLMRSDSYRRRLALIRARELEEMEGLVGQVKASVSRVLTEGLGRGLNPRDIAKSLTKQAAIEERRANRIARTEISTALRRARWDESEDAMREYGLKGMQMHLSALSPTTRRSHAERHSKLYTTEGIRDWYAQDGNSINCKCNQVFVLVDERNRPLVPDIQARARAALEKHKEE